ncbi:50S ribosomal protein L13 [Candidatus Woesearchaeota archaeon]|nr:50S ribosomal protein L13 [Candidatus Woesearchaeota archaeon]
MIIIDAKNQIVGRIGVVVAKQALLGEEVAVINCEKAVITGSRDYVLGKFKQRRDRGVPRKGPFYPRMPDRFVRRSFRGMLPMDKTRGREAFKRIMCYMGVPKDFEGKKTLVVPGADRSKLPTTKIVSVDEICRFLGGSWNKIN